MSDNNNSDEVYHILSSEEKTFSPPEDFRKRANISSEEIFEIDDYREFWAGEAEKLDWFESWDEILNWDPPRAEWFTGGKLNASYNCLDRHLESPRRNKAAIIWEGEPGEKRTLTYQDLHREVNKFANVLRDMGVEKGDTVSIYLPMIPEVVIAMLACARIGAPHSVIFAGFGADAVASRLNDAQSETLITVDGYYRRGKHINHKERTDKALEQVYHVENCIVVERSGSRPGMKKGRDYWWGDLMSEADRHCEPEVMNAEDLLFIMYTSGTTGKPKGVVHTTGGYLTQVTSTAKYVFDLKEEDTFWCAADIGWITGHSYLVYGILANGATSLMYEGAPDHPDRDRYWDIVEKYGVSIFYTAPTAIRSFMRWGRKYPDRYDLSSLRLLGSVGETLNPGAWYWYYRNIGDENCPIVDTWWQAETGGIMLSPLPGVTEAKPGSVAGPLPGIDADVLNDEGEPVESGYLAITRPWPGMLRTIYGDDERYVETYWEKWDDDLYFTADGAKKDDDGHFWIMGRVDDVINVSGHSLSTMEIESALVNYDLVAEAAVVGGSDQIKGQVPVLYATLKEDQVKAYREYFGELKKDQMNKELKEQVKEHVIESVGPIAAPRDIYFVPDLPKTRSGKIMRRLLEDLTEDRELGDTTTLKNPETVEKIREIKGKSN